MADLLLEHEHHHAKTAAIDADDANILRKCTQTKIEQLQFHTVVFHISIEFGNSKLEYKIALNSPCGYIFEPLILSIFHPMDFQSIHSLDFPLIHLNISLSIEDEQFD